MVTLTITVFCIIGFFVLKTVSKTANAEHRGHLMGAAIAALVAGILLPLAVGFYSTFRTIPPGNVGVTTLFGAVRSQPLAEGFNITMPLVDVTNMSVQMQKHLSTYTAATKDMQTVHVDMVLNFRLEAANAPAVFQQTGTDYVNIVVDPAAQEVLKAETAGHDASDLLMNRPKVMENVHKNLKLWLDKYHIVLEEVAIAEIKFDPTYQHAIEEKQKQQQIAQQREYELQQAQKEAEIAAAKAKGLADSRRIMADAEADYNKKVAASITPEIIKMEYLKRWNGELPRVDGSGKTNFLLNVDSSDKK